MLVISYAFIAYYTYQKEINIIESNCIKIEFEDLTEAINLTNVYPMTDEAGERTKPYRFSIRNQCNVGVDYSINLEVLKTENRIPSSNIAVKIDQNIKQILTNEIITNKIETTEYIAEEAFKLYTGTLNPGKVQEHEVKIWLDESAGNESQNKVFQSKIVINAIQNEVVLHEDLTKLAKILEINPKEMDDLLAIPEEVNKMIANEEAMQLLIGSDYLKENLKQSENYTETIKRQILDTEVISETEKYSAGLPFYLFKNRNTGFTWTSNPSSMDSFWCATKDPNCRYGVVSNTASLYIADNSSSYYMGGELYTENINLKDYQNLTFSYSHSGTCSGLESQYRQEAVMVGINNDWIWSHSYDCANKNEEITKDISTYSEGNIIVLAYAGGLVNYISSFSIPIMYLY